MLLPRRRDLVIAGFANPKRIAAASNSGLALSMGLQICDQLLEAVPAAQGIERFAFVYQRRQKPSLS